MESSFIARVEARRQQCVAQQSPLQYRGECAEQREVRGATLLVLLGTRLSETNHRDSKPLRPGGTDRACDHHAALRRLRLAEGDDGVAAHCARTLLDGVEYAFERAMTDELIAPLRLDQADLLVRAGR